MQASVSPAASEEEALGQGLLGSLWALFDDCRAPAVAAGLMSTLAASSVLLLTPEAASAYTAAVDKAQAEDILLNIFGIAFTVTAALFLLRIVNRRASRATSIKLARDRLARTTHSCHTTHKSPADDSPLCPSPHSLTLDPRPFFTQNRTNPTPATSCPTSPSRRSTASARASAPL